MGTKRKESPQRKMGWCLSCNTPVLDQEICGNCGKPSRKFTNTQITPIFEEEIRLMNALSDANLPTNGLLFGYNHLIYGGGKIIGQIFYNHEMGWKFIPQKKSDNPLECSSDINTDPEVFVAANAKTIQAKAGKAKGYIRELAASTPKAKKILTDFSGGKDSLVVTTLVREVFPNAEVLHIKDPTTLPETTKYVEECDQALHLNLVRLEAPEEFWDYCKLYGFPSVFVRWCCKIFRFIPVSQYLRQLQIQEISHVLEFQGIRASESYWRASYQQERTGYDTFIRNRTVAFPIFDWSHLDVWAYILANNLPYNPLYRKGWRRVGCWACPFTTEKADGLLKAYYPEYAKQLNDYLFQYAQQLGRSTEWVVQRRWRTRYAARKQHNVGEIRPCAFDSNTFYVHLPAEKINRIFEFSKVLGYSAEGSDGAKMIECLHDGCLMVFRTKDGKGVIQLITDNETQLDKIQKVFTKALNCTGCGFCLTNCPRLALDIDESRGHLEIDEDKCSHCFQCYQTRRKHYLYGCHNLAMQAKIDTVNIAV